MSRIVVMIGMGLLVTVGCRREDGKGTDTQPSATFSEVKEKARVAATAATDYAVRKAEEYERQMRDRLATLDKDIEALKKKGEALSGEAREKWEQNRPMLEEKLADARKQLELLKESGGAAWEEARERVDRAWAELQKAADDAEKQVEE